jgi:membrane protease YdiL (CAAX protease family)
MIQGHPILIYSVSYLVFFALLLLSRQYHGNRLLDEKGAVSNRFMLLLLHIGGILLLGVLSSYSFNQRLPEIIFGKNPAGDLQLLVTGFFVILALFISPKIAEKKYCRMKAGQPAVNSFNTGFITNYFLLRILFLCAYETWFRGYLLTDCINSLGIPFAIIINIILYVLLHYVNGKQEMRACVPFGLLLCGLCIWIEAAWPAILVHLALAVSYEVRLVKKINKSSISFV